MADIADIESVLLARSGQFDLCCLLPEGRDIDIHLVWAPGAGGVTALSGLLDELAAVLDPPVSAYGSIRDEHLLHGDSPTPPLHIVAWNSAAEAAGEPPLLLRVLGCTGRHLVKTDLVQAWRDFPMPPLRDRLQRYRRRLAELTVLVALGPQDEGAHRGMVAGQLNYIARHGVATYLFDRGVVVEHLARRSQVVEQAQLSRTVPSSIISLIHLEVTEQLAGKMREMLEAIKSLDAWLARLQKGDH